MSPLSWLILCAVLGPACWGVAVHWCLERIWPPDRRQPVDVSNGSLKSSVEFLDYQI